MADFKKWLRRHWKAASVILFALVVCSAWWMLAPKTSVDAPARIAARSGFALGPGTLAGSPAPAPQDKAAQVATLKSQLELAEHTLCSYQAGTQYPQESRPIAEHPDQVYPNHPVEEVHAMRTAHNKGDPSVQIASSQSRVYVASGEAVQFTLSANDSEGKRLPLQIRRAVAHGIAAPGTREGPQTSLIFTDDGSNGDAVANDGTHSSTFIPASTGLAGFSGTIRIEVQYSVGERSGFHLFDIIHTAELPAVWSGPIREAVEEGSLNFYLKADVRKPGRYLISARVDDANGKPFALVSFNDVLGPGPNDIKLTVFGKLLHDESPALPLRLRDVDGYLLKEDADPDRALMPRLAGTVHVSKTYPIKTFSDAEWQSEVRSRHLEEFAKDVRAAKEALHQADPQQSDTTPVICAKRDDKKTAIK